MYRIQLQDFEGPLDLLLFFIKRDELDIYNIPIAYITEQFLEYIHVMEELDLGIASEFIWMASMLISIKAKMLLPREGNDEEDLDEEDPRYQLVQALLEYKKYKEMATELHELDHANRVHYFRANTEIDKVEWINDGEILKNVTLVDLMVAIREILSRPSKEPAVHQVQKQKVSIEQRIAFLTKRLADPGKHSFLKLCAEIVDRHTIVVTFLATLEMVKEGKIFLYVGEKVTDFFLEGKAHTKKSQFQL